MSSLILKTAHLQRIFKRLDKDGDGVVSIDELILLLGRMGVAAEREEVELLIGENSFNSIDFLFFCQTLIMTQTSSYNKDVALDDDELLLSEMEDLRKAFRVFDLNGDGFISCEELHITLSRFGLWDDDKYSGLDCKHMIDVFDSNSDGFLDFHEFKDMIFST